MFGVKYCWATCPKNANLYAVALQMPRNTAIVLDPWRNFQKSLRTVVLLRLGYNPRVRFFAFVS